MDDERDKGKDYETRPYERSILRRQTDQDFYYLIDRVDGLEDKMHTIVDTVGPLATKSGQDHLDLEKQGIRLTVLETWQARLIGMFAVVVFEIPLAVAVAALLMHK